MDFYFCFFLGPPDSVGVAIYRSQRKIGAIVGDGNREWRVEVQDMIPADIWKNVGFSWNVTYGLKVKYLNIFAMFTTFDNNYLFWKSFQVPDTRPQIRNH